MISMIYHEYEIETLPERNPKTDQWLVHLKIIKRKHGKLVPGHFSLEDPLPAEKEATNQQQPIASGGKNDTQRDYFLLPVGPDFRDYVCSQPQSSPLEMGKRYHDSEYLASFLHLLCGSWHFSFRFSFHRGLCPINNYRFRFNLRGLASHNGCDLAD